MSFEDEGALNDDLVIFLEAENYRAPFADGRTELDFDFFKGSFLALLGDEDDIIAFDGNPLQDVNAAARAVFVMKGGHVYENLGHGAKERR